MLRAKPEASPDQPTVRVVRFFACAPLRLRMTCFRNTLSEISYRSIEGITHSTGMMYAGVQILGLGGTAWRIDTVKPKEAAKRFADSVRELAQFYRAAQASTEGHQASNHSDADELDKWARLLKDGVVTQDEFDVKKKQLLGLGI